MADSLELDSLFRTSNKVLEPQYEKVEFITLNDNMGNNYDSGQIQFLTDSLSKSHIVYSDSYLVLPITVSSSRATATGTTRLAIKNSLLSLIQGLSIESGAGTVLVGEEGALPIVQNLKLLIDSSTDFIDGNELHYFGKDQYIPSSVGDVASTMSVIGGVSVKTTDRKAVCDPTRNPALASRISVFKTFASDPVDGAVVGAATPFTQKFVAYLPLKYIHDFFAQMNFPMVNLSLKITFNIAGAGGYTSSSPFSTPSVAQHLTLGDASVAAPLAGAGDFAGVAPTSAEVLAALARTSIAAQTAASKPTVVIGTVSDKFGVASNARLVLKQVFFQAAEALALAKNITAGFKKTIVYMANNYYKSPQVAGGSVDQLITQGIIRPVRVWCMPVPAGTILSSDNTFPASISPYTMTNFNLELNGNPVYQNSFKTQYQFYNELKSQLIGASTSTACGTPITFTDFCSGLNPYCFDLSRNPTVKSNNQCAVNIKCDVYDTATGTRITVPYELIVCIERLMVATFSVSEGGVSVMARQGDGQDSK